MENSKNLLEKISGIGRGIKSRPEIKDIDSFQHFLNNRGEIIYSDIDKNDGKWSRREIITRYLLLSAVLDQGPDMTGVRLMVRDIVNYLYKNEIRIFHRPLDFFKEIGITVNSISDTHEIIKKIRSVDWARDNHSNPDKYNLFMDNCKQVLNYAIFRWGVPLSIPMLLEKDGLSLVDYLEKYSSSEIMSQELKDNERYGLGKAVGDKAAHLFAKWYVSSFAVAKNKEKSWGELSFELPMDSNAGRVLFRTGYIFHFATPKDLKDWEVIQKGRGKSGKNYIRVTNLRGKKSKIASKNKKIFENYLEIYSNYLKIGNRPRTVEIQRIPNVLLLGTDYGISDLDDGLMYVGTNFCFNLEEPKCEDCPLKEMCDGYKNNPKLIRDYRT